MPNPKNPWVTISSKEIYDNQWIALSEDEVINPGCGKSLYSHVSFKNNAIGIIPLDDQNNTWLVGQHRYPLDEYSWEIPMGGGPIVNSDLESAKRELAEETGITASDWSLLLKIHTSNSVTNEVGYVFVARDLKFGESSLEESESDLVVKKLPISKAIAMAMEGEITDSLSLAGLLKIAKVLSL